MSDYLAYTSGVVRLFDTLDAANAWLAEVGGGQVFAAVERLAAAEALLDSRAGKLLRNGKTFVVVAVDEPYFFFVYELIRKQEKHKGRWTPECEAAFQAANKEVSAILAAKAGGGE